MFFICNIVYYQISQILNEKRPKFQVKNSWKIFQKILLPLRLQQRQDFDSAYVSGLNVSSTPFATFRLKKNFRQIFKVSFYRKNRIFLLKK